MRPASRSSTVGETGAAPLKVKKRFASCRDNCLNMVNHWRTGQIRRRMKRSNGLIQSAFLGLFGFSFLPQVLTPWNSASRSSGAGVRRRRGRGAAGRHPALAAGRHGRPAVRGRSRARRPAEPRRDLPDQRSRSPARPEHHPSAHRHHRGEEERSFLDLVVGAIQSFSRSPACWR